MDARSLQSNLKQIPPNERSLQFRLMPRAPIDRLLQPNRNELQQLVALYHGSNRREKDDVFELPLLLIPCTIVEIPAGYSTRMAASSTVVVRRKGWLSEMITGRVSFP
jgi:hypothetical protein